MATRAGAAPGGAPVPAAGGQQVIAGAAFTQNLVDLSGGKNKATAGGGGGGAVTGQQAASAAAKAAAAKDPTLVDPPNFFVLVSETSLYAGGPNTPGSVDGAALNARFHTPSDIVANKYQELFVADTDNASIRRISKQGAVSTIAAIGGGDGEIDNCTNTQTAQRGAARGLRVWQRHSDCANGTDGWGRQIQMR
jgi:hypothetical protein